ncbi:MAG: sigma-70 family RNA polymerase sigma factor, partial [Acetatifactor sp.]|nr:sigma-70 family RNA polymerase sigma factor [Acetatifactor sp.]
CMELQNNIRRLFIFLDECLTDREREIILLRYGLGGRKAITQNEIGAALGISRSYVSRIEKRALQKLRERFSV